MPDTLIHEVRWFKSVLEDAARSGLPRDADCVASVGEAVGDINAKEAPLAGNREPEAEARVGVGGRVAFDAAASTRNIEKSCDAK